MRTLGVVLIIATVGCKPSPSVPEAKWQAYYLSGHGSTKAGPFEVSWWMQPKTFGYGADLIETPTRLILKGAQPNDHLTLEFEPTSLPNTKSRNPYAGDAYLFRGSEGFGSGGLWVDRIPETPTKVVVKGKLVRSVTVEDSIVLKNVRLVVPGLKQRLPVWDFPTGNFRSKLGFPVTVTPAKANDPLDSDILNLDLGPELARRRASGVTCKIIESSAGPDSNAMGTTGMAYRNSTFFLRPNTPYTEKSTDYPEFTLRYTATFVRGEYPLEYWYWISANPIPKELGGQAP